MPAAAPPDATELLQAWSRGDASAFDKLVPLVHRELRALAGRYMRNERPDHTLQPTSLVNEAYLRLIDVNRVQWQNRAHFLAVAANTMRRILVEFARKRHRQKRGGGITLIALDDAPDVGRTKSADLVAVDGARGLRHSHESSRRTPVLWRADG
jgi:RNA polymerase sigma factor (TIGR02999 family)